MNRPNCFTVPATGESLELDIRGLQILNDEDVTEREINVGQLFPRGRNISQPTNPLSQVVIQFKPNLTLRSKLPVRIDCKEVNVVFLVVPL